MKNVRKNSIIYWYSYNLVIMHLECVVIVAYKKTIKREKQEGIMSARRKQLIALSVVLVCVIGMAAYGIIRVSNKTADKGNGFDVAMTDTDDKSEDGLKDSDKTEKKEKKDQNRDAKKDDSVKEEDKRKRLCLHWI